MADGTTQHACSFTLCRSIIVCVLCWGGWMADSDRTHELNAEMLAGQFVFMLLLTHVDHQGLPPSREATAVVTMAQWRALTGGGEASASVLHVQLTDAAEWNF
ncbi:hypothetical protein ED733_004976 [Metarhizium rileyi]|uniref:Uncharacterized protein n=1 Tax=Metarhizium rileyi (strain RCEF 4871) TaxID=1649241 RepID=A0A5C6GAH4_METRR|nr:hypothetical protein ED733_004976 [Metarhizium rileyi]